MHILTDGLVWYKGKREGWGLCPRAQEQGQWLPWPPPLLMFFDQNKDVQVGHSPGGPSITAVLRDRCRICVTSVPLDLLHYLRPGVPPVSSSSTLTQAPAQARDNDQGWWGGAA